MEENTQTELVAPPSLPYISKKIVMSVPGGPELQEISLIVVGYTEDKCKEIFDLEWAKNIVDIQAAKEQ